MPRNFLYTRDEIIQAALSLTREQGIGALTARALGHRLGTTAKPIFSQFASMEEVQCAVRQEARRTYETYLRTDMQAGHYPPYKASGMAYIRFAREERELFWLLFMRDRSDETMIDDRESVRPLLELLQQKLGLSEERAALFHGEMWLFAHGIAVAVATNYLPWEEEKVSQMMTDVYMGLRARYETEENEGGQNAYGKHH